MPLHIQSPSSRCAGIPAHQTYHKFHATRNILFTFFTSIQLMHMFRNALHTNVSLSPLSFPSLAVAACSSRKQTKGTEEQEKWKNTHDASDA